MSRDEAHLARLVASATYGYASFTRPATDLVDELQQAFENLSIWGLLLSIRLAPLRARDEQLGTGGDQHG